MDSFYIYIYECSNDVHVICSFIPYLMVDFKVSPSLLFPSLLVDFLNKYT